MRPMLFPLPSVNQTLLPRPDAMPRGVLEAVGSGNSVMTPLVVMRPILFPLCSANQRLPSGPAVIKAGPQKTGQVSPNSVMTPLVVMRPILFPLRSVNQRLPSGPGVIPTGLLPAVGTGNSVIVPAVVQAGGTEGGKLRARKGSMKIGT